MAIDPRNAVLMRRAGLASVAVAVTLILVKLYAFVETGSVSMLSTLFNSALDFGASLINLFAISQAVVPADAEHRFGHGKAEPLAGLVQVEFILGSSILLLWEVADHFMHPQQVQNATTGVVVMVFSIAVTGALILFQRSVVKRTGSLAVTADAAHYATDFAVNISVIVALILSSLLGWWWIDPVCGLLVSMLIGVTAVSIGRQALDMLMDREMEDADRDRIKEIARAHPEVVNLHDLRTRVSGQDKFIQFHLELSPDILLKAAHRISDEVEAKLMEVFPGAEVIIHQDPYGLEEGRKTFPDTETETVTGPGTIRERKTVVLTGASRGIGHATVQRFSAEGWRIVTCSRESIPEECKADPNWTHHITADLAKTADVERFVTEATAILGDGPIHALVNNAAISPKTAFKERLGILNGDVEAWREVFELNFFAPLTLARGFAKPLHKGKGAVVNITSIAGHAIHPFAGSAYSTSKAALSALTREMAVEFASLGVRVNAVAPGEIETAMIGPEYEALIPRIPMGRMGTVAEVAGVVFQLCGSDFSYVTGTEIFLTGGQHLF